MSVGKYKNGRYIKMASIGASDIIDSELSNTSTNPVQNKAITDALNNKANSRDLSTLTQDYDDFKVLTRQALYGSSDSDGFYQNISEINYLLEDSAPYNRVPLKLTSESTATLDEENQLFFEPSQVAIFETLVELGAYIAVEFACDYSDVDWEHTSIKCRVVNDESSQEWEDLLYNSNANVWYCRYHANGIIGRVQIKIETTSELDTEGYDNCFYGIIPFVASFSSIGSHNVPVRLKGDEGTFPKYDFYYSNKELTNKINNLTENISVSITTPPYKKNWTAGTGASETLYDVTYGNGRFVSVGNGGTTYYSTDGINWTAGTGVSTTLLGVTYGNKRFVAVGESGVTYYSTDGINWTAGTGASGNLLGITYGNGIFVAVGESGATYYSIYGINWIAGTGASDDLYGVAYFNGIYVAVGTFGATYYSTDGIDWTAGTGVDISLYDVTYGNGRFVSVGNGGTTYYSTDGINWTAGTKVSVNLRGVAYFNGIFVAVGSKNPTNDDTYYSTDGINWASITELGEFINGVTYGDGQFVAVGESGATYYLQLTSQTMTLPELSNLLNPLTIYQDVIRSLRGTFIVDSAQRNVINGITVKQQNKVIGINGCLDGISISNGTRSKLGVIRGVDMPTDTIRGIGGINTSGIASINNIAYIEITMQGDVYVTPLADAGAIAFNITYIAR